MKNAQNIISTVKNLSKGHCRVIAVSKKQDPNKVIELKQTGHVHFGENYVQELTQKQQAFLDCTVHFIGHLQTNKSKEVVKHCAFIHSIDRIKLANSIEKACQEQGKRIGGFIQINLTNEQSKGGISPEELPTLVSHIRENCPHIQLLGLMYIPPKDTNPEPLFVKVHQINKQHGFTELSMGMSNDYETAIKNGATYVRIGTAIFGQR